VPKIEKVQKGSQITFSRSIFLLSREKLKLVLISEQVKTSRFAAYLSKFFTLQTMRKLELIKQLESLIAFQTDCLASGDWDSFDRTQDTIKKLEEAILGSEEKYEINTA
jgi:hypothetical protein